MDQNHEDVAHSGTVQSFVEERISAVQNRFFAREQSRVGARAFLKPHVFVQIDAGRFCLFAARRAP